jgi:hypothetical protein
MPHSKHEWMDVERYLAIHDRCVERASVYFREQSSVVSPDAINPKVICIHGDLHCKGGLVIHC